MARVDRVLDRIDAGAGSVVVVEGPAGIGKSELLAAACADARARGIGVLIARGSEFEEEIAFGVARQLFELNHAVAIGWQPARRMASRSSIGSQHPASCATTTSYTQPAQTFYADCAGTPKPRTHTAKLSTSRAPRPNVAI